MAKNRGKNKFVVGSSSERENVPSGRLPKSSRGRPSERPLEKSSIGWDASEDERATSDRNHRHYVDLLHWFLAQEDNHRLPSSWLPNLNYILREDILAVAGLSRIFDREYGFSCIDPKKLGISLDLKTIHDPAPEYKFGKDNPRNPRLKDYVLSPLGVARISEVRADPWDSASSVEAVPVKVVLPELKTTSDPGPGTDAVPRAVPSVSSPARIDISLSRNRDQRKRKGSTLLRPSTHPKKAKASQPSEKEAVSEVMPPPKNLLHFMPLPGQKLKSVVVAEPPAVDQPLIEEDIIPSPLKPSAALGIEIQDITEVMEAIEADFVPGSDVPEVAGERKESADLPFEREKSPDKEMIDLSGPEAAVPEVQKEKAGQLLSELTELKQLYLHYSREARESAEKIGTEEMKSKFEAADKERTEAELRLHHFVQHRELIQQQADKVPVLRLKLREKDDYIRKLEQERVNLYTADQCL
ncbi:uncharacterized protein [Spinacia oleracea]|uniref:Uncharacterized protein n=1 Tax=Spinacia oleracea TaxID=3562 RepID=A0ABM3R992_SPIOL|nr:uncharacterized protein LOC130467632 [Spinacia oleracea]